MMLSSAKCVKVTGNIGGVKQKRCTTFRSQPLPGSRLSKLHICRATDPDVVKANIARLEAELARLQESLDKALPGRKDGTLEVPCHGDVPGAVPTESAAGADAVQASLGSITTGVESGTASHAEAVAGLAAGSSAPAADAAVTPAVEAAGEAVDAPDEAIQVAGQAPEAEAMEPLDLPTEAVQDTEVPSPDPVEVFQATDVAPEVPDQAIQAPHADVDAGLDVLDGATAPQSASAVPGPDIVESQSLKELKERILNGGPVPDVPADVPEMPVPDLEVSGLQAPDVPVPALGDADSALHDAVQRMDSLLQSTQATGIDGASETVQYPILGKLQAALDSIKAAASGSSEPPASDTSFKYAAEQLKSLARQLGSGGQEVQEAQDAARQSYWLPQGVEGEVPVLDTDVPVIDPSDPLSSYWMPNGVSPSEGEAFAGDLLDPSATGALQDAMKDIMEALNVPVVPGGSAEQAVDAAGQGSTVGTMWQSINHIAEQLMAQFQSTPGLGSLPFAGRVLAYVLAIVGVGFLMREAFPKSEEANEGEAKASAESASESSASPTKMEWPPLASEADEADLPPIEPQVLDPHAAEAEEHSVNDHIDIQVDTIDVGSAFADDASSSDNGNESPSQDKSPVFANANAPSGQLAMVEEDSTYPSPVLPWMDEDPAGWGPADMDEFSVLDVKIPEPSLAPAIRSSVPETPVAAEAKVPPEPPMKKAQDPEEVADLDDERARDMDTLAEKRVLSTELRAERGLLKEKLWWVVRGLGPTAAVVPGGEPVRFDIDDLIEKLERITPLETPLNIQADSEEYKYMTVRSKAHPHLLGSWRLEYASNTQVVQENMVQQVLQLAEAIPGFGVGDVRQQLSSSHETDHLISENTAVFGLGPLGSWQISVSGTWMDNGGGICAKSSFQSFSVRPVEIMGIPADALPEIRVSVPAELQAESEWCTTYCDKDFRIGRGTMGNLFVFRKDESMHVP